MPGTATLIPTEGNLIIKPIEAQEGTPDGIYLPDQGKEKPVRGKVLAVGCARQLENGDRATVEIVEGATVIYGKYTGHGIDHEGENLVILRQTDVLAFVSTPP